VRIGGKSNKERDGGDSVRRIEEEQTIAELKKLYVKAASQWEENKANVRKMTQEGNSPLKNGVRVRHDVAHT